MFSLILSQALCFFRIVLAPFIKGCLWEVDLGKGVTLRLYFCQFKLIISGWRDYDVEKDSNVLLRSIILVSLVVHS